MLQLCWQSGTIILGTVEAPTVNSCYQAQPREPGKSASGVLADEMPDMAGGCQRAGDSHRLSVRTAVLNFCRILKTPVS